MREIRHSERTWICGRKFAGAGVLFLLLHWVVPGGYPQTTGGTDGSKASESVAVRRSAQNALQQGNTGEAIRILTEYLQKHPDDYVVLATLGETYERSGQFEKAEPLLGSAVKASHGDPQVRMEWAVVLVRMREYKKAESAMAGVQAPSEAPLEAAAWGRD